MVLRLPLAAFAFVPKVPMCVAPSISVSPTPRMVSPSVPRMPRTFRLRFPLPPASPSKK